MNSDRVEKVRKKLKGQAWEAEQSFRGSKRTTQFPGLCGDCKHLQLVRTQYGEIRRVKCNELDLDLNPRDPVVECADHWSVNHTSLSDLIDQAQLLEIRSYSDECLYL